MVDDLEQYSRKSNVIISGIKEQKNESVNDLLDTVIKIGAAVSLKITDCDIDVCHRLRNRKNAKNQSRPIIVKFPRRLMKSELVTKVKKQKASLLEVCTCFRVGASHRTEFDSPKIVKKTCYR